MICPGHGRRPKNAAATRQAMLEAARLRFLQESYENVGLRDIAGDVGVDVALVSRYFGSKEELFREVLHGDAEEKVPPGSSAADLPGRLACLVMQHDGTANQANVDRLLIILRSSSSPIAAEIVRDALKKDVLEPMEHLLEGPGAEVRASLAVALMAGAAILRSVMEVGPLCGPDRGLVGRKLVQLFETALAEVPEGPSCCGFIES